MPVDLNTLKVFRIIPIVNLAPILEHGIFCKNNCPVNPAGFVSIGNQEIIDRRNRAVVKCFPGTVVNDYVPFYFSVRTPMLYNIKTGWNVPQYPQRNIIYLSFRVRDLATQDFQWCYTDGNAAVAIAKFHTDLAGIEKNIDWTAINTSDFGKERDTIRKKHAEFLVRDHVPSNLINNIVVINEEKKTEVENILAHNNRTINVTANPKFYF